MARGWPRWRAPPRAQPGAAPPPCATANPGGAHTRARSCRPRSRPTPFVRQVAHAVPAGAPGLGLQAAALEARLPQAEAPAPGPALDGQPQPLLDHRPQGRALLGSHLARLREQRIWNLYG